MKPIHKLNNGRGATLCHTCSVIITTGLTKDLYCDKCKPKQETLEEVAERLYPENWESIMDGQHDSNSYERNAFIKGVKWQQERSYSEEDMQTAWNSSEQNMRFQFSSSAYKNVTFEQWLEAFKKE